MQTFKSVIMRIVAVIAAESLGVIGAGSVFGIELWKAASLAGVLGAAKFERWFFLRSVDCRRRSRVFGNLASMRGFGDGRSFDFRIVICCWWLWFRR